MTDATKTSRLPTPRAVSLAGLIADALLSGGKVAAGAVFGSQTILADGLHSASDLVTDAAVLAGLRVSKKPADADHHYGHRRVATLVGLFVGAMLLLAAGWIVLQAAEALQARRPVGAPGRFALPLAAAVVSVIVKEGLFRVTHRVGEAVGDVSLTANAWHHRTDAASSGAAALGLAAAMIGGPDWAFLDSVTAIVLSAFLVVMAGRIIHHSASELVDRAPAARRVRTIAEVVSQTPGVRSHHALRARKIGGQVEMDIHVQVDPDLTVHAGHEIAGTVKRRVKAADPGVLTVVVHVEPAEEPPTGNDAVTPG